MGELWYIEFTWLFVPNIALFMPYIALNIRNGAQNLVFWDWFHISHVWCETQICKNVKAYNVLFVAQFSPIPCKMSSILCASADFSNMLQLNALPLLKQHLFSIWNSKSVLIVNSYTISNLNNYHVWNLEEGFRGSKATCLYLSGENKNQRIKFYKGMLLHA